MKSRISISPLIMGIVIVAIFACNFSIVHTRAQVSGNECICLYRIDFIETDGSSMLDSLIDMESSYAFAFEGNYSEGWTNAEVEIKAWYDRGLIGDYSAYPEETEVNRNSAFSILYTPSTQTASVLFPQGSLELEVVDVVDTVSLNYPGDSSQSRHLVVIEVIMGPQVWAAAGDDFTASDEDFNGDPAISLLDPWSWDFSITLCDKNTPSVSDTLWAEFGVSPAVSISVEGNPSGEVEPGDSAKLVNPSLITVSSNVPYWLNVSLVDDLKMDGIGPSFIPVENMSVMNVHPSANVANSEISEGPTPLPGPGLGIGVWGTDTDYLMPAGNGTATAGPWMTDYNMPGNYTTQIDWWVSVPRGTPLGVYWATVTYTIESADGVNIVVNPFPSTRGGMPDIAVVDHTPPSSYVTETSTLDQITANASDGELSVTNVTLWYRYSPDNENWGNWIEYETDYSAPWSWTLDSPDYDGYYDFYSIAEDEGSNFEEEPVNPDFTIGQDAGTPGFEAMTFIIATTIAIAAVSGFWRKRN